MGTLDNEIADAELALQRAWLEAKPEIRDLGKDTLQHAADLAKRFFETGVLPSLPMTGDALTDALATADQLDAKLGGEVQKRRDAAALAKGAFALALQIALKAAIAGLA